MPSRGLLSLLHVHQSWSCTRGVLEKALISWDIHAKFRSIFGFSFCACGLELRAKASAAIRGRTGQAEV